MDSVLDVELIRQPWQQFVWFFVISFLLDSVMPVSSCLLQGLEKSRLKEVVILPVL